MTIRCKAAVLRTIGAPRPYARSKPLSIEDVTLAPPKPVELGRIEIAIRHEAGALQVHMTATHGEVLPVGLADQGGGAEPGELGVPDVERRERVLAVEHGAAGLLDRVRRHTD